MPFVPIPEEKPIKVCRHREHNPPGHIVIRRRCKWVCPACGAEQIIIPNISQAPEHPTQYIFTEKEYLHY